MLFPEHPGFNTTFSLSRIPYVLSALLTFFLSSATSYRRKTKGSTCSYVPFPSVSQFLTAALFLFYILLKAFLLFVADAVDSPYPSYKRGKLNSELGFPKLPVSPTMEVYFNVFFLLQVLHYSRLHHYMLISFCIY